MPTTLLIHKHFANLHLFVGKELHENFRLSINFLKLLRFFYLIGKMMLFLRRLTAYILSKVQIGFLEYKLQNITIFL